MKYENYSVEELREALNSYYNQTTDFSDEDMEEIGQILTVLQIKNPLPHRYTTEESWAKFQEYYSEELAEIFSRYNDE